MRLLGVILLRLNAGLAWGFAIVLWTLSLYIEGKLPQGEELAWFLCLALLPTLPLVAAGTMTWRKSEAPSTRGLKGAAAGSPLP